MRRRIIYAGTAVLSAALLFGGCGKLPAMTARQEESVTDYAAQLLLKYNAEKRSRLVDLSEIDNTASPEGGGTVENGPEQNVSGGGEKTPAEQPEQTVPAEEETQGGMGPVDDTPVVPAGEETGSAQATVEQVLGLPEGVTLTFGAERVAAFYPDAETQESYFGVDATEGKSLLILPFRLENTSQEDVQVDILAQNPLFRVTVNGQTVKNAMATMMTDDLSTYIGTLAAGTGVDTVLLVEFKEEELQNISTISLTVKSSVASASVSLK